MLYPYISMLERNGLSLRLLRVQFYFTRFNRVVHQLGRKKPRFLYWWFTLGAAVSILSIAPAVWVLATSAMSMSRSAATGKPEVQILEPAVRLPDCANNTQPRITVPRTHLRPARSLRPHLWSLDFHPITSRLCRTCTMLLPLAILVTQQRR